MAGAMIRTGKRGTVVIPAQLRRQYGIEEGSTLYIEEHEDGLLLKPAVTLPVEVYTPARKAELFLNNAVSAQDYSRAREEVLKMGIDPDTIDHDRPDED